MGEYEDVSGSNELEGLIGAVEARLNALNQAIEEVGNVQLEVAENSVNGPVRVQKRFGNTSKGQTPIAMLQQSHAQLKAELVNLKGQFNAYMAKVRAGRTASSVSNALNTALAKGPRLMVKETFAVAAGAAVAAKEIKPAGETPINMIEFRASGGGMKVEVLKIGQTDLITTTSGFIEVPTNMRIRIPIVAQTLAGTNALTFGVSGGQAGNLSVDAWFDPDPIGALRLLS